MEWLTQNWATVIVPLVWTIDQLLKLIVKLTPSVKDDNVVDMIGSWIARFFPKGQ